MVGAWHGMNNGIHQKAWCDMMRRARAAPESICVWTCLTAHYKAYIDSRRTTLPRDEQDRAVRFRRPEDRDRYVLGRLVVRNICAGWFAVPVSELDFGVTTAGRPFLKQAGHLFEPLDFNVSHSGDCTLVAWSPRQRVGVDIERVATDGALDFTRLAEKAFSPCERGMLASTEPHCLALTFYRIWVRKEALLKAEGLGLSESLSSFSVVIQEGGKFHWAEEIVCGSAGSALTVVELTSARGHVAALAKRPGVRHFQYPALP